MAIIKQHDKRSGITYAYESHSYWDPEKKMTRAKRKLIGRVDPETGEIVPTDGRNKKQKVSDKDNADYKKLYEKLLKKYEAQKVLIDSLKKQLEDQKNN
jgi:alpha-ketoglutarate-dependent taurine dioxygenase